MKIICKITIMEFCGKKREYNYVLGSESMDFTRRAKAASVVRLMLDCAGADADACGLGVRDLNRRNASWVLLRFAADFRRMPAEKEPLVCRTWVKEVSRAMTTRCFEVVDAAGTMVAAAVSNWAMIGVESRSMLDLHELPGWETMTQDFPLPAALPRRLAAVVGGVCGVRRAAYGDLDFNRHVNSVSYLEWMFDTLPLDVFETMRIARLDVNYLREVLFGQEAEIVASADDRDYRFELRVEGRAVCRMTMSALPQERQ